jgi:predicted membrane protein
LKAEKKENMVKMRAYKKVMGKNKKLNKINLVVLAAGLLLTVLGMKEVGNYLLWTGTFVFFITAMSGIFASGSLRKQR